MSQFLVSSTVLGKTLARLSFCISKNPIVPILENVKLEWNQQDLTVTASDLQNTLRVILPIDSTSGGTICAPYKLLKELLDRLPEQPVTLAIDESYGITVTSDTGTYKLSGENPVDFPKLPELIHTRTIDVNGSRLAQMLSAVHPFCSTDELRPAMTGVYLRINADSLLVSATNGHSLSVRHIHSTDENTFQPGANTDDLGTREISVIMPGKVAALLASLSSSHDAYLTLEMSAANIRVADLPGGLTLTSRLIDERFPDFENAIPVGNPNVVTLNKTELVGALKRINLFANKTTHQLRFSLSRNKLVLSAEDLDCCNEGKETLRCDHDGDSVEIGFDTRYVMLSLNSFDTKQVRIEIGQPNRAAIMLPADAPAGDKNISLCMPTMLNTYA